jgi:hypothetical protein
VGGPKTRGLRRGIVFAAVVALHAGLVILTVAFRTPTLPSASTEFITALIFLTAPLPPVASSNHCARRRRTKQVSSIELRTARGLSGSAIAATSSLRSPHLGCRRSWRVPSLQERCVSAIRSLGATCSKICRRTRRITRSSSVTLGAARPGQTAGGRREARPPACPLVTSAVLPAGSVSRVLCGSLPAPLRTERLSRQTPRPGR